MQPAEQPQGTGNVTVVELEERAGANGQVEGAAKRLRIEALDDRVAPARVTWSV
jgi:hypothetical protein